MSVKIEQLNLLKVNDYNKMIIKKTIDGYKVNVRKHGETLPKIMTSRKSASFLDNLTDEEKIEQLIEHFLNYNMLNYVSKKMVIPYYYDAYACAKGDRELYFSLPSCLQQKMISRVKSKYHDDRMKAVYENNDIKYYNFKLDSVSSYDIIDDKRNGKQMEFCLLGHKKELNGYLCLDEEEQLFFKGFLWNKLNEEGQEATIDNKNLFNEEDENYVNLGYYVNCGDMVISIDSVELFPKVVNIVDNYNKERCVAKKKQLKLEGF